MKTFTTILAFSGLLTVAIGAAVPVEDISANIAGTDMVNTACGTCSNIYNDCKRNGGSDCYHEACWSYVNGQTCSALCLWYCK